MLARHGQVVPIPHNCVNMKQVQAELEAATGLPLHQAFVSSVPSPGTVNMVASACLVSLGALRSVRSLTNIGFL